MSSQLKKANFGLVFSLLFLDLIFFGCTKTEETPVNPHLEEGLIPVGVFLDLSGPTKSYGQETYQGLQLAIEKFNESQKADDLKIKLITKDTRGSLETTRETVTELIEQDQVVALIGEVATQLSLAAARIAQAREIPMLSPASSTAHLTDVGPYIFRTCIEDSEQGAIMAHFAKNFLKASRAAIFTESTSEYSSHLSEKFKESFERLNGTVVEQIVYKEGFSDFEEHVQKLAKSEIDAVIMPGYYKEAIQLAKALKQKKAKVNLIGGDNWEAPAEQNTNDQFLNGAYITSQFHPDNQEQMTREFVDLYKARYTRVPRKYAALGFDAASILVTAVKNLEEVSPKNIKEQLKEMELFQGVTGEISLGRQSRVNRKGVILQIKDGSPSFVTTVSPK